MAQRSAGNVKQIDNFLSLFENNVIDDQLKTHWVGFDKYKKLIYGVQRRPFTDRTRRTIRQIQAFVPNLRYPLFFPGNPDLFDEPATEPAAHQTQMVPENSTLSLYSSTPTCDLSRRIAVQSIFGGTPRIIHSFERPELQRNPMFSFGQKYIERYAMNDREIVFYGNYVTQSNIFFLFSIENGFLDEYQLSMKIRPFDSFRKMAYTKSIGWMAVIGANVYRVVFDDTNKTCEMDVITKLPPEHGIKYVFSEINLTIFHYSFDFADVFDFEEMSWSKKVLYNFDRSCCKGSCSPTCTDEGEYMLLAPKLSVYAIYKLVGDRWEQLHFVSSNSQISSSEWDPKFLCSKNILFIKPNFVDPGIFVQDNVLSLRDIAFKKIVNRLYSFDRPLSVIVESLNLPTYLVRQYCGPSWVYDQIKI